MTLRPCDLLASARFELARRGDAHWSAVLRRFENAAGELPKIEASSSSSPAEQIERLIAAMTREQRRALRRLLHDLGVRGERRGGHGPGSELEREGCMCGPCDPLGDRAESQRRAHEASRIRRGATVH